MTRSPVAGCPGPAGVVRRRARVGGRRAGDHAAVGAGRHGHLGQPERPQLDLPRRRRSRAAPCSSSRRPTGARSSPPSRPGSSSCPIPPGVDGPDPDEVARAFARPAPGRSTRSRSSRTRPAAQWPARDGQGGAGRRFAPTGRSSSRTTGRTTSGSTPSPGRSRGSTTTGTSSTCARSPRASRPALRVAAVVARGSRPGAHPRRPRRGVDVRQRAAAGGRSRRRHAARPGAPTCAGCATSCARGATCSSTACASTPRPSPSRSRPSAASTSGPGSRTGATSTRSSATARRAGWSSRPGPSGSRPSRPAPTCG